MRAIKLRVWDKRNNKFFYFIPERTRLQTQNRSVHTNGRTILELGGEMRSNVYDVTGEDYKLGYASPDSFEWQEWTGRLDVDNKEIYEGDLVELHYACNTEKCDDKGLYEVFFDRGAFYIKTIKPNWLDSSHQWNKLLADLNICKVVGNLYEKN